MGRRERGRNGEHSLIGNLTYCGWEIEVEDQDLRRALKMK